MVERGIDVSKHNGSIDWKKVKEAGISFVIVRGGYSQTEDPLFKEHVRGAKKAGLKVGVYWFSYAVTVVSAVQEANRCTNLLNGIELDLPIFYDFEYDTESYGQKKGYSYTKTNRTAIIKAFCDTAKENGYEAGVYLNLDYIRSKVDMDVLKDYKLWFAQWGKNTYTDGTFMIWQYSSTGKVDGISGNVDLNFGYFDEEKIEGVHEWSEKAVRWAVNNNILKGDGKGNYMLDRPCTREELVTMLYRTQVS